MNQTYVYRRHLRAPFKYLMLIEMLLFLVVFLMMFGLIFTDEYEGNGFKIIIFVIVMLVVLFFLSLEIGVIYLIIKRFKSISVTLADEAIVYTNSKGQITIPFEDIERLEFPSVKYMGGWVKIIYKGGNIRLTVVLEHIGDFISQLKEKINEKELTHVYNEKRLFSFYKTAVFSDESWERLYHNSKVQLATHYLCIILTTAILMLFANSSDNKFFMFGSLLAPLVGYLVSEIIIGIQSMKRIKREELRLVPRNPRFEQKLFKISVIGFSIVYLLIILVVKLL